MVTIIDPDIGPEEVIIVKDSKTATEELLADILRVSDDCCVSLGALRKRFEPKAQATKRPAQTPTKRSLEEIEDELKEWQVKTTSLFFLRDRLSDPINKMAAERIAEIEKWRDEQLAAVHSHFEPEITRGSEIVQNLKNEQFKLITETLAEPEKFVLNGCEKVTCQELNEMTLEQIEALVWKRSGKKELFRYYKAPDGVKPKQRSLQERRKAGIQYLKYNSCRFCHDISHGLPECPTLKAIQCGSCGQYGHTTKRCEIINENTSEKKPPTRRPNSDKCIVKETE